ncbi:MAG: SH3 domain-containing protein [Gemella haemolysans]|uniref:SH3 domain-containing protein n=1 Tax=Gemella haemolysans TaxID=1379 RepID=UPI00290BC984|nr:SH3 domain-containing protein [Gemella haemolysans]MDU6574175.1 SH3 domain-containing protein [Gemella haemolysans]
MNRNSHGPNNQNFNNQNFDPNYNYDPNMDNTQYSNQGYDQQYQNTQYQGTQYQNFEQSQDYNNQQQNYNVPPMYMEEPKEKKKSIIPVILTAIITFVVLVVALYFGYNKFLKKENVVDLATYEVNFVTYGAEGEGKPEVDIKKVPEVANSNAEISNLLSNPDISFDKQSNLKNGDKVEVTISLNKNTANKLKLKTTGEFKRTFTVNGLNEKAKEKETIIVKESSANSSSSSNEVRHSVSGRTAYVKPSVGVNLRSDKNDSSRIITSIKGGASVTIRTLETNSAGESWAYVYYGSYTGYIRGDLLGGY